ncbi:MAG: hypothetical protein KC731_02890 [Myxococcales bacterium]|nr:hypothetical protein [Myxococcales bacterium]
MLGLVAANACSPRVSQLPDDEGDGGEAPLPEPSFTVGAAGVTVDHVTLLQGPERVLAAEGEIQESDVPIIQGRDTLIRGYYRTTPERVGTRALARLELPGRPALEQEIMLSARSTPDVLGSTANFLVPGEDVGESFLYRFSILGSGEVDHPQAHHPSAGLEAHWVEGRPNTMRVMLVPFAYHADGSGRVPVLDATEIEAYRKRLLQLFPVSKVEIAVREPISWSGDLDPTGVGWAELHTKLLATREQEKASDDWYYYGVFQPTETMIQFCQGGCLLGLSVKGPPPQNADLRLAIGVGYPEVAPDTASHELGHTHGLRHAPCGNGIDPNTLDLDFPYDGGSIGRWSWDIVNHKLVDPGLFTDFMGYCDRPWISDYHYRGLFLRAQAINQPALKPPPPHPWLAVTLDGHGQVLARQILHQAPLALPGALPVSLGGGASDGLEVMAHRLDYDHLDGSLVLIPLPEPGATSATLDLDGQQIVIDL